MEEGKQNEMRYNSGIDLEEAVFGRHSNYKHYVEFFGTGSSFVSEIRSIIEASDQRCPNTDIGSALHHQIERQFENRNINSEGLVLLSAVDTKADFHHHTDGFLYSPSFDPYLVTIDLFNIDTKTLLILREKWIDSFDGEIYTEADFQSDLFHQKRGSAEWRKVMNKLGDTTPINYPDLRHYDSFCRPENHFIITPYHLGTYEKRRETAKLIAGYFEKVSSTKTMGNNA